MIILPGGGIDNALLFGAPGLRGLPWGVRRPAGGRLPAAGVPARQGQGPFLFLRKKKRALTPKKKKGPVYAGLMGENGGQRLSYDCGDHSRPLRPALGEQGQADALPTRRLRVPLSGLGPPLRWRGGLDLCATPRCTTAALCHESGTSRRRLDRTTAPSLFHYGTAVTAGAGPQTVRKDARRRGLSNT